ncbi:NAD(P)H-binding protein [Sphingomonas sp. Sphisp140]|uniref:NmrA family NAD(P)-binding protein n=1 Tax=unclassified Sphingomonas TaxID=196159 RepID=UPI0039B02F7F
MIMFAIIGATGNVGFSTARALRDAGAPVRAILRNAAKGERLTAIGCGLAIADLQDSTTLARAIAGADAVQIIIPLHLETPDPAQDMRNSIASIIVALRQAAPKRVLAISDYGAHVDRDIGMPSIFHSLEAELHALGGDVTILRSAEHMHNAARGIPEALKSGTMLGFQDPVDRAQATIAAEDLGRIAAELLLRTDAPDGVEIVHAEGPRRYSAADVAAALSALSSRTITAVAVPREHWEGAFAKMPPSLADLLIKASDAKNKGGLVDIEPDVSTVRYGPTELIDALRSLLPR